MKSRRINSDLNCFFPYVFIKIKYRYSSFFDKGEMVFVRLLDFQAEIRKKYWTFIENKMIETTHSLIVTS